MMKKLMFLMIAAFLLTMTSCNKDAKDETGPGEITFTSSDITDFEKKGGVFNKDGEVPCDTQIDYAIVWIDGVAYNMPVVVINGMITTQSLKFDVGTYTLNEFFLMNYGADGVMGGGDDLVVKASTHAASDYADFATFLVPYEFEITAFTKTTTHTEVFCLEETDITAFGFNYWSAWEITVRQECFFGDVCVLCPEDYVGSAYASQLGGVLVDNAAITKVDLYVNGVYVNSTDNMDVYGEGVVCVNYPDRLGELDEFEFMVYVWLPSGTGFSWVYQFSYTTTDDIHLNSGSDNVNEFVIGDCLMEESETNLAQYVNLPATVDFSIASPAVATLGHFDLTFSGIGAGYIIDNITYPGFCAQNNVFITPGNIYSGNIYTTLDIPAAVINADLTATQLKKLHFLVNLLDGSNAFPDLANLLAGDEAIVQNVIWHITDGAALNAGDATSINALVTGGWASYAPLYNEDQKFVIIVWNSDQVQLQVMQLEICE